MFCVYDENKILYESIKQLNFYLNVAPHQYYAFLFILYNDFNIVNKISFFFISNVEFSSCLFK